MPDAKYSDISTFQVGTTRYYECYTCGATVGTNRMTQHDNFHLSFTNIRSGEMSKATWCDYGDHAYKAGIQGSATFNAQEFDENGTPQDVTMDACPDHNPLRIQREAAKLQIPAKHYEEIADDLKGHNND